MRFCLLFLQYTAEGPRKKAFPAQTSFVLQENRIRAMFPRG